MLNVCRFRRLSNVIGGEIKFGQIPHEHWFQPDWIDEEKATASRNAMVEQGTIYGGSVPYRNMCRFNSGVRLADAYRYMRIYVDSPVPSFSSVIRSCKSTGGTGVSSAFCAFISVLFRLDESYFARRPDVNFHCHLDYDPFLHMEKHNKTYGA